MEASHEKIIEWIDSLPEGDRFAIWQIAKALSLSPKTVTRVLVILRELKLIGKMPRGYMHKYWEVTRQWTDVRDIVERFELFCIMAFQKESRWE